MASNYNQGAYKDYNNTTSDYTIYRSSNETVYDKSARINAGTVSHTGAVNMNNQLNFGSSGRLKFGARALTTATTGTAMPQVPFVTVSSTKTAKSFTIYGSTVGTRMTIFCLNASATGYIQVSVDSSAGANSRYFTTAGDYLYQFKKGGHGVEIMLVSTGRWMEISRTVADGTAITSTAT